MTHMTKTIFIMLTATNITAETEQRITTWCCNNIRGVSELAFWDDVPTMVKEVKEKAGLDLLAGPEMEANKNAP